MLSASMEICLGIVEKHTEKGETVTVELPGREICPPTYTLLLVALT